MSAAELETLQKKKLAAMLRYAATHVPYYKKVGLSENATLNEFPILTKTILRNEADDLLSTAFKKEALEKNYSSGSSGVQSFTYMTHSHKFYLRALQTHWWMWGGYSPGEPLLQAGMSVQRGFTKKLKDLFFRVVYMDAFHLTKANILQALRRLRGSYPKHLAGYPSALHEIAKIAIEEKKPHPFKCVISYGDKLYDHHKKRFSEAFDEPTIINTYGCAEGLLIASTADLPYYYIMTPHVFLEIVDDEGKEVKAGERGHILVTGLTSFAMPLIRYKLGDLGVLLRKEEYPEVRRFNYPLLEEVTGRETDVIKTPNGNVLIVHSFTGILEYYTEIEQFKIVQMARDAITLEYRTQDIELPQSVLEEIHAKISSLTEGSMQLSFKKVDIITATPSGKPQIIEVRC